MSSDQPLPTVPDMLDAYGAAVRAQYGVADVRRGAAHDVMAGIGALLWVRQCQRDQDLFRCVYFDGAQKQVLADRIEQHGGPARIRATRGEGTAGVRRPTVAGGAGRFWAGTRIAVYSGGNAPPRFYRVAADTDVTTVLAAVLPIEAEEPGAGWGLDTTPRAPMRLVLEDAAWDTTWTVESLLCAEGTDEESDRDYLARYRQAKIDRRRGYAKAITDACKAAGAAWVALFESDYVAPDTGLNRCFVADASFSSTPALQRACRLAIESARPLGCDLTVGGMQQSLEEFEFTLTLARDPGQYNKALVINEARHAVLRYLADDSRAYVFHRDALEGEIARAVPDTTDIAWTTVPADTVIATALASANIVRRHTNIDAIRVVLEGP